LSHPPTTNGHLQNQSRGSQLGSLYGFAEGFSPKFAAERHVFVYSRGIAAGNYKPKHVEAG